jgi:uncharacterized protein YkwD
VRHRSASPPSSPRRAGALRRLARPSTRSRSARLGLGAMVSTVLASFVLTMPVASSGSGETSSEVFTSFASAPAPRGSSRDSPVVMGVDGGPVASTYAGIGSGDGDAADPVPEAADTPTSAPGTTAAAPDTTAAVPPAVPATPVAEVPVEEPAEAAAPTPAAAPAPTAAAAPAPTAAAPPAPTAAAASAAQADPGVEEQVLALVNAERADEGCGALVADEGLAAVARAHSADMRDRDYFGHVDRAGLDPFDRAEAAGVDARAENIAMGQPDAEAVMASWMDSSGHRASILDCSLTSVGVGVAEGSGGPWWTQLLG